MSYQGAPELNRVNPMPPYNATNFNSDSAMIFQTLQTYAATSPNYPLPVGSNARQLYENTQNVSYFAALNQKALHQKNITGVPYPVFRSESERLMYLQGQYSSAARNQMTGRNPSAPAGVPVSTLYQILNSS